MKILLLALALVLASCSTAHKNYTKEQIASETKKINEFFEAEFQSQLKDSPMGLTYIGLKERYDELGDPSYEFYKNVSLKKTKEALKKLKTFNYDALTPQAQLSYRLFEKQSKRAIENEKYYFDRYFMSQMYGPHSSLPSFMINMHRVDTESDAKAYVKRLWAFKPYFNTIISEMKKQDGITYPFFIFDKVISDSKNIISGYPFDDNKKNPSPLYSDFQGKVSKLKISSAKKKILMTDFNNALNFSVKPSYNSIIALMGQMKDENSNEAYGVWALEGGKKYYNRLLSETTTTDLSANEIHEIGLKEMERIHSEMIKIGQKLGVKGGLKGLFAHVKSNEKLFYPNTKEGRQAYLEETNKIVKDIKGRLDELFITLPKAKLLVKPVEPFREKSAGIAFYQSPALNGSRPGIYYVNLSDMSSVAKYDMEALIYHEALPGHHMQLSLAQEMQADLPTFRKFGSFTAFTEGWGLYAEYIPKEIGMYKDPYSDFGRLSMELWRAARLVVDTGIHSKKWSYDKSLAYLRENTPNSEDEIVKGVQRYFVNPSQATAYKVGQLKILDLKNNLEKKLKADFDIKRFHDAVLRNGTVPLYEMEREVKKEFDLL
jgi:uncharacterized protein (DUF885 family)